MFSEYCAEPFVTEPVEVVDAFGQSTGAGRGNRTGSCPYCCMSNKFLADMLHTHWKDVTVPTLFMVHDVKAIAELRRHVTCVHEVRQTCRGI